MTEETNIQKSLMEQVLDEMFASIEGRQEFDADTIQKLKQLAMRGDLTKETQIIEAIKLASGEHRENP